MAQSPRFKVHNPRGEYVASCKFLEDAAALVANYGEGAKIKDAVSGALCWHEGREDFSAADSWDGVRDKALERIHAKLDAFAARHGVKL